MIRILLADDHEVVRRGLKQVLAEAIPHAEFGDATDGEEALRKALTGRWDIVILDMTLPRKSGLDVLKELRQAGQEPRVLILSMHPEEQFAVRALKAGAAGYLTKKAAARDLVTAVQKVLSGGTYVSSSLAERLAAAVATRAGVADPPHAALSDREYQVFRMLALGKTVKEIGEELSLSPQTVSTHRTHVLEKMQMTHNSEFTQYAIWNGLLE